ncbi:hypothetical protein HK096_000282 [Nowakowskiella sp. JEL0078]|nr:hypothetical protein HK096_000282 [Nowakowskiella sp. JEL0078]
MQSAHARRSYANLIKSQTSLQARGRSPSKLNAPSTRRIRSLSPCQNFENAESTNRLLLILGESSSSIKSRSIFIPSEPTNLPQILDKTIWNEVPFMAEKKVWTIEDDQKLVTSYVKNENNWSEIGRILNRTAVSCQQRLQQINGNNLKREPIITKENSWTKIEDRSLLISIIKNENNWIDIGRELNRTAVSCYKRSQLLKKKFNHVNNETYRNSKIDKNLASIKVTKKRNFPESIIEIARSVPKNVHDVAMKSKSIESALYNSTMRLNLLASFRERFEVRDSLENTDLANVENQISSNITSTRKEAKEEKCDSNFSANESYSNSTFPWLLPNNAPRDIGDYKSPSNELPIGQHFTEQAATKFLQNIGATSYVNKEFLQGVSVAFKSFTEAITSVSQNKKPQIHVQLLHSMLSPALYLHMASAVDKLHKSEEQILLQMSEENVTSTLQGVTIVWGPDIPNAFSQYELLDQSSDLRIYSYGPEHFLFKWFSAGFVVPKSRFITPVTGLAKSFLSFDLTAEKTPGTFALAMEAMNHGAKVLLDVELTANVKFQHIKKTVEVSPVHPEVIVKTRQIDISEGGGIRALMDIARGIIPPEQMEVRTSAVHSKQIKDELAVATNEKSHLKKTLLQFETPYMKHNEICEREIVHTSIYTQWFGKKNEIEVGAIENGLGSLKISDIDNLVESQAYSRYVMREKLAEDAGFEEETDEQDSYNAHTSFPNLDPKAFPKIE